ncbi:MAG: DNA-processing protein DprA [Pseudomonadota bacterium]
MTGARRLTDDERLDWIQLARTPRIGPVTFAELLLRFKTAKAALEGLPELTARRSRKAFTILPRQKAEDELGRTRQFGADILCSCEDSYSSLLKHCAPPPPILTVLGQDRLLAEGKSIALVGSRDASAAGRKLARDFASGLGVDGYVTVSGLARGIDGEVHAASLETGTIAVLGGGIDHIYPPQHERLFAAIASQGAIVSESPFGHRATARDFPRRNRIITGLSRAVIVIEAAERSGSLISARTAGEQGREVMAVPGSPLDPRAAGTNRLLRDGATLVRNAQDVLEALSGLSTMDVRAPAPPVFEGDWDDSDRTLPEEQIETVEALLTPYPIGLDDLARAAGLSAGRVAAILMELELAGRAETLTGGLAQKVIA